MFSRLLTPNTSSLIWQILKYTNHGAHWTLLSVLHRLIYVQPLRPPYKVFPILLKTHRHTIFLEAPATKTVESLKEDALSAMTAKVNGANDEDIPEILSVNDFEICREIKEKRRRTGNYVTLEGSEIVQKVAVAWETLYIRFKDSNGNYIIALPRFKR